MNGESEVTETLVVKEAENESEIEPEVGGSIEAAEAIEGDHETVET